MKDIKKIFEQPTFASKGGLKKFNDEQRAKGWESIGKEAPESTQFNVLQNDVERGVKYLYGQIREAIRSMSPNYVPDEMKATDLRETIEGITKAKAIQQVKALAAQTLAKDQNGADIPDKNQFVKNLGLTETVDCAKNALDKRTGGTVNGDIISQGGQITLKGDGRKHFILANADDKVHAYIWKDKGGDGIHINNGIDGGGDYIFHKDGGFRAPASVYAGAARIADDGNIYGSQWGDEWLDAYLRKTFQPKGDYSKPNTAKSEVSGWWKCGDTGYTTQYGHVLDLSPGEVRTVDFNIPFKQAVRCIVVTPDRFGFQNGLVGGYAAVINNKSFNLTNDYANEGHNSNFWWMAVGM